MFFRTWFVSTLALLIYCLVPQIVQAQPAQLFSEAQELLAAYRDGEAMLKLEQVLKQEPQHYPALCQLVLIKNRIAGRTSDEATRLDYLRQANDYAHQAFILHPDSALSNYVMALSIGGLAQLSPIQHKVAFAFEMKRFLDRALQLDSANADAWQQLARWNFKIASLSWFEKLLAKVFFGGVPGGATKGKAIDYLQKAIELQPNNLAYYYDLARVYESQHEYDACVILLRKAMALQAHTKEDQILRRRCRAILQKYDD